jgi:hypothetical protein
MKKVFLGGTCNNSTWRDELIEKLEIEYFNPVVDDWTEACMLEEIEQREKCSECLYVITPKMTGVFAIAEAIEDSITRPEKTILCVLEKDGDQEFDIHQLKSLKQVCGIAKKYHSSVFNSLQDVADFLNLTSRLTVS